MSNIFVRIKSKNNGSATFTQRKSGLSLFPFGSVLKYSAGKESMCNLKPGYNDVGLYDTSSIETDILWYQLIRHC
jgi:hypothetical protein